MKTHNIDLKNVMLSASSAMIVLMMLSKAFGYAFHMVFAIHFDQNTYGSFVYLFSLGLVLAGLMPNIPAAIGRYIAFYRGCDDDDMVDKTKSTGLALSVFTSIIWISLAALAYYLGLLPNVDSPFHLAFLACVAFLVFLTNAFGNIMSGYRLPQKASLFNTIFNLLRLSGILLAAALMPTLSGAMGSYTLVFTAYLAVIAFYSIRRWGIKSVFDIRISKKMISFGFFTMFLTSAGNVLNWADILIIGNLMGYQSLAVYNIAWMASTLCLVLFISVLQIYRPVVTEFIGRGASDRISHLTNYMMESFMLVFIPAFLLVFVFAHPILSIFIGEEYSSGAPALMVLSFGTFFWGISLLFMELLSAQDRTKTNAKNIVAAALVNIFLNLAWIPRHGMLGAAYATLFSSTILLSVSYYCVRDYVNLWESKKRLSKLLSSAIILSFLAFYSQAASYASDMTSLFLLCALLLTPYGLMVFALGALRHEDIAILSALMEKTGFSKGTSSSIESFLSKAVSK